MRKKEEKVKYGKENIPDRGGRKERKICRFQIGFIKLELFCCILREVMWIS